MKNQVKSENRVLIAIPAFNEESRINSVLQKTECYRNQLLFVDDGSTDQTGKLIENAGFRCIRHRINLGLTEFYNTVLKYAVENNYTHMLTLDSDGQHEPECITKFLTKLEKFDLVVGNRFHNPGNVPEQKLASNLFAALLLRKVVGLQLPDVACGFRGLKIAPLFVDYRVQSFGVVYDMIIRYIKTQRPLDYVNIPVIYHPGTRLVTKTVEIVSLINVIRQYADNRDMERILISLERRKDFKMKLFGFEFIARYSEPMAYVFHTDHLKALQYFRSFNS